VRWERLGEEPRLAAEFRRLATPQDRTGAADAQARPASSTATTASTSTSEAAMMVFGEAPHLRPL
jgi:hypothetical protein